MGGYCWGNGKYGNWFGGVEEGTCGCNGCGCCDVAKRLDLVLVEKLVLVLE